jgi:molybdopterin molybdotransferase
MSKPGLISVDEALSRVLAAAQAISDVETVGLLAARGRTLAGNIAALRTQPPTDVSAMDGYGLRAQDLAVAGARVQRVGTSAAGAPFDDVVQPGQCVRIFTGAAIPAGVDTVLLQEDALVDGDLVGATAPVIAGKHIRARGLDFAEGAVGLSAGVRLGPAEIGLAAAMNHAQLRVTRRPRIALLATGDELVPPGTPVGDDKIVCSNTYSVAALIEEAGGEAVDLGIAPDNLEATQAFIARARDCDALVTLGGASVGEHDYVKQALANSGMELGFWKLAMRPGKPLIHGVLNGRTVLGLPGNPVSSMVCAMLFLQPLVRKLSGGADYQKDRTQQAFLGADVKPNDFRQDFLRATLARDADGRLIATPFALQDSSMISIIARSQALVIRPPNSPAARAGEACRILPL